MCIHSKLLVSVFSYHCRAGRACLIVALHADTQKNGLLLCMQVIKIGLLLCMQIAKDGLLLCMQIIKNGYCIGQHDWSFICPDFLQH